MFFIKGYIQIMMRFCFNKLFQISENKNSELLTLTTTKTIIMQC